ncbi:MAG TPA: D-aminoacyl-tRNA deacylase [Acidimicrobiales bacterium]|nr:D-aminoacyl-tRNA deacylase [Acidimicrobiales bacterium]
MRAVVQRVSSASVSVDGEEAASIGRGLCVLVGVERSDDGAVAERMAERLWNLRIFEDDTGKMNRSAGELDLAVLVVSQFTLCADTSRGRRPSFVGAAPPEQAEPLVDRLVEDLRRLGASVATGRFRAHMTVSLVNDGPVTIVLDQ